MDPKLLDAFLVMLWARLVQSASVQNVLALEAGTAPLPLPQAPWVMVQSFVSTGVVTATPEDPEVFLTQITNVVENLCDIYDKDIPSLMEISAAKGGKFGASLKVAQRIHEIRASGSIPVKA